MPTYHGAKLDALQEAARARNIELSIHQIATGEEIAAAIDMAKASGATALNVLASPLLWTNRRLIMDRAAALRLPAIYQWPEMAEEGGFAAYGPRLIDVFRDLMPDSSSSSCAASRSPTSRSNSRLSSSW